MTSGQSDAAMQERTLEETPGARKGAATQEELAMRRDPPAKGRKGAKPANAARGTSHADTAVIDSPRVEAPPERPAVLAPVTAQDSVLDDPQLLEPPQAAEPDSAPLSAGEMEAPAPSLAEAMPPLAEATPSLAEVVPPVAEAMPSLAEVVPALADAVEEAVPVVQSVERPRRRFPYEEFATQLDPGAVKARYQVGPIDPTIVFIGDLDERHGPDLILRAMPPILRNHPQTRLIIVGDGQLLWPLRVMSRYMLLDHAVRIVGHVGGTEVRELVAAADVIAVPSRVKTEDWQILAGWSARRPVVATHPVAGDLCRHEENGVLIYANPGSCVWGVERVLFDPDFGRRIGERGYQKVVEGIPE